MTPDTAIRAHREWKVRFLVAMAKQEQMNVAEISADHCCKFGNWLHASGKFRFGHLPSFKQCLEVHAAFHAEAGKIAEQVNQGKTAEANRMLGYGTPYTACSEALTVAVVSMFKEAELD
jgi:methyl-accepting chemotaxis protein